MGPRGQLRWRKTSIILLVLCGAGVAAYLLLGGRDRFDPVEARRSATAASSDLRADLKLMWETKLIAGGGTGVDAAHNFVSTYRGINAASRVFNTIDLKGMSPDQVVARLGDPGGSSNSIYNFPFYPPKPGDIVYRFDSGDGGWQFDLHLDSAGKVASVERLGID